MLMPYTKIMVLVGITVLFISCATKEQPAKPEDLTKIEEVKKNKLRIGITPNYPPMIFKLNGKISGVEADLAKGLAKELNRSGEFIDLNWEDQIPALMQGTIDIIMSGMTITQARKVRIDFTDHYMKSGLLTLMRSGDADMYTSLENIRATNSTVGVIRGTTGEAYVRKNFPYARVVVLAEPDDAPFSLRNRRLDLFVHDAPSIIWLVSENEAELTGFWRLLNEEYLGWGVRQDDKEFLAQVNSVIGKWKKDGTLKEVLVRWLPYLKRKDLAGMIE
jgi:polar amino acid transport system substrate-binding protein